LLEHYGLCLVVLTGDEWKAAFITSEISFEPTVIFFGLTNLSVTFQTIINKILQDLINIRKVESFIDNIIIEMSGVVHTRRQKPMSVMVITSLRMTNRLLKKIVSYGNHKINIFSDVIILDPITTFQTYDFILCDTSHNHNHVFLHCLKN